MSRSYREGYHTNTHDNLHLLYSKVDSEDGVKGHYDLITKMNTLYGSPYYCVECDKPYWKKNPTHRCRLKTDKECFLCKEPAHPAATRAKKYCNACNQYCFNEQCLDDHQQFCATMYKLSLIHISEPTRPY